MFFSPRYGFSNIFYTSGIDMSQVRPFGSLVYTLGLYIIKGIFRDSNNIFLWHKSEDINKKWLFPKFQLILILSS